MSDVVAKQMPGPINANDIKNPSFGWMMLFLLLSSSAGLFSLLPLQKVSIYAQIADYNASNIFIEYKVLAQLHFTV